MQRHNVCKNSHRSSKTAVWRRRLWLRPLEERIAPAIIPVTSSLDDSSGGTLREALALANSNFEADTISFAIGAGGAATITLTSSLPPIFESDLVINGQTQMGWTAAPIVQVVGGAFSLPGFDVQAANVTIKGLVITNNSGGTAVAHGISLNSTATGAVIEGNYIGINLAGTAAAANTGHGIHVNNVGGAKILNNVISGNSQQGIRIEGADADANIVQGNIIGLNAAGTAKIANAVNGINIYGDNNIIGTNADGMNDAAERNVISGNTGTGIVIQANGPTSAPPLIADVSANGNLVRGNIIGLNLAGSAAIANTVGGVLIQNNTNASPRNNRIGGPTVVERNIISGNTGAGIRINRWSSFNTIQNNYIGTDINGMVKVANTTRGIYLNGADHTDMIANVVSGNTNDGITIDNGGYENTIRGNIIGLDALGNNALGNTSAGVGLRLTAGTTNNRNVIGGTTMADRNIISGNTQDGINIQDQNSRYNIIQGNYIGTDITGMIARGNATAGIRIGTAAVANSGGFGNVIGGPGAASNLISGNGIGVNINGVPAPGQFQQIKWDVGLGGNDHFYVVSPLNVGWLEAEAAAVKAGGHLASIADFNENNFIQSSVLTLPASSGNAWIGLNDRVTEGTYVWTDDPMNVASFTNWDAAAEPNNFGDGEDFCEFRTDGLWNDNGQYNAFRAVMEFTTAPDLDVLMREFYPPNVVQGNRIGLNATGTGTIANTSDGVRLNGASRTVVGTDGDGLNDAAEANVIVGNTAAGINALDTTGASRIARWTTEAGGNDHYYMLTGATFTWQAAHARAQYLGGNLVSIDSDEENTFIQRNLMLPVNVDASIGFTDDPAFLTFEGAFVWTDGAPVTFTNWNNGEPNNGAGGENFTVITAAGGWNDVNNSAARRFIMEFNTLADVQMAVAKLGYATTIAGNFIGVRGDGTTAGGNGGVGVLLDTVIGVTVRNNTIGSNNNDGIRLTDFPSMVTIENNKIGTTADGTTARPNNGRGVAVITATSIFIRNNTIAANTGDGIQALDRVATVVIEGNNIGVAADGLTDLGNGGRGVSIRADVANMRVGTDADGVNDAAERNIIAGNTGDGVTFLPVSFPTVQWTTGTGANNNYYVVFANPLRWADAKAVADSVGAHLVSVGAVEENNFLAASVFPIAGSTGPWWLGTTDNEMFGGVEFGDTHLNSTTTSPGRGEGWIWTDGTTPMFPAPPGYQKWNASEPNNQGDEDYAEIQSSGNWNDVFGTVFRHSILEFTTPPNTSALIAAFGSQPNFIRGNLIGVGSDSTTLVANGGAGVLVQDVPFAQIGGATAAAGNFIAGNTGAGVVVTGSGTSGVTINNNRIFNNGGLGIDLGNDGVTLNDADDADTGPNGLLNFPVITIAKSGAATEVAGTYDGLPNASVNLEFFASATADPSMYGEGQRRLGSIMVMTDGMGHVDFSSTTLAASITGEIITAIATHNGNTSEFALGKAATGLVAPPTIVGSIVIAGGSQRSLVKDIKITFSEAVTIGSGAFALKGINLGPIGNVELDVGALIGNSVTITFKTGGGGFIALDPGLSLPDGQYELTINADKISGVGGNLDGNKNGTYDGAADNVSSKLHRLFGDANGDGSVTASDFNAFRLDYGITGSSIFDFDNSGSVNAADFNSFRLRYGQTGYQP